MYYNSRPLPFDIFMAGIFSILASFAHVYFTCCFIVAIYNVFGSPGDSYKEYPGMTMGESTLAADDSEDSQRLRYEVQRVRIGRACAGGRFACECER